MTRILVTGSRDWPAEGPPAVSTVITKYVYDLVGSDSRVDPLPFVIVHGACPTGADAQAQNFVDMVNDPRYSPSVKFGEMTSEQHPANWDLYGKRAGFIRNNEMVRLGADVCLAFIKDHSKGASMTLNLAASAGIPCVVWRL